MFSHLLLYIYISYPGLNASIKQLLELIWGGGEGVGVGG